MLKKPHAHNLGFHIYYSCFVALNFLFRRHSGTQPSQHLVYQLENHTPKCKSLMLMEAGRAFSRHYGIRFLIHFVKE